MGEQRNDESFVKTASPPTSEMLLFYWDGPRTSTLCRYFVCWFKWKMITSPLRVIIVAFLINLVDEGDLKW